MRFCASSSIDKFAERRTGDLPYGTLKRVEVARALAARPRLLLLDEPAAGLAQSEVAEFGALLRRLRERFSLTILLVEHNMRLVMSVCERIVVLHLGTKAGRRHSARSPERRTGGRRLSGGTRAVNALEVTGLVARYGTLSVLNHIDLVVRQGEMVALLGANGAGKTTTLRAISGVLRHSGSIKLYGAEISGLSAATRAGLGLAHVPQGRGTFASFTVEENLWLGAHTVKNRAQIDRRHSNLVRAVSAAGRAPAAARRRPERRRAADARDRAGHDAARRTC